MVHAQPPKCDPGCDCHEEAGEDLHPHEAFDLVVDLVEDLDRDLLFRYRSSADLYKLPLIEVTGDQEEVHEEHHEHELPAETEKPEAAGPEIVARSKRRRHDLYSLDTVVPRLRRGHRIGRVCL